MNLRSEVDDGCLKTFRCSTLRTFRCLIDSNHSKMYSSVLKLSEILNVVLDLHIRSQFALSS